MIMYVMRVSLVFIVGYNFRSKNIRWNSKLKFDLKFNWFGFLGHVILESCIFLALFVLPVKVLFFGL